MVVLLTSYEGNVQASFKGGVKSQCWFLTDANHEKRPRERNIFLVHFTSERIKFCLHIPGRKDSSTVFRNIVLKGVQILSFSFIYYMTDKVA